MQSLLISDDNGRCEAVARNILQRFYFSQCDVLGYKRAGLYCTQAKTSCLWVMLIDIFHEAWYLWSHNPGCCNVKPAFVDVAHKLRKRYSNISQILYFEQVICPLVR